MFLFHVLWHSKLVFLETLPKIKNQVTNIDKSLIVAATVDINNATLTLSIIT